jgi:hypothetical protein
MLEERGFATVALASVRAQAEKTRPPRALWTTSQMGRPLGEPNDPAFQRRVILAALALLERTDGPVILQDFTEDPPGWADTPGWTPPVLPGTHRPDGFAPGGFAPDEFATELMAILPLWQQAQRRHGRTSVGLSLQPPEAWPAFAARFLAGELPIVAPFETAALSPRFACDDIKALYGEAAQAVGQPPSARQIDAWFWRRTAAGRRLLALREAALASRNNALKTVGGRFFVPAPWLP